MDNSQLGNMAWTATLFGIAWYFFRNWMRASTAKTEGNADALAKNTERHSQEIAVLVEKNQQEVKNVAKELARITADTAATIKDDLKEHRAENKESTDAIKLSIDKLSDRVATANGRTMTNEKDIALQKQRCEDRTIGNRKDDCRIV